MDGETITINRHVVFVRRTQRASTSTLIFVHGIGVAGDYFLPLARELDQYSIIIIDLPGYGKAPKPTRPLGIGELAETMEGVVRHYGITSAILIGHSMGCQIAARLITATDPTYVKAILLSPSTNKDERSVIMQGIRLLQDIFYETLTMNILTFKDYLMMGPLRFLRTSRFMIEDHIEDSLVRATVPVVFFRGSHDRIVPQTWIDYLQTLTPDSRLIMMDDLPHNFHYVDAPKTAAAIMSCL